MITIALDEQGDFENLENKLHTEPVFIGGVIYDDRGDPDDYKEEKERLHKYLENVCTSVDCYYPRDLHFARTEDGNNARSVRLVKEKIGQTIKDFLRTGTFEGADMGFHERKGRYHIFVLLRGKNGKNDLLDPKVSEAVRDDFASNLYIHMAEDVVERLIFHNPVIRGIESIHLDLATRRVLLEGEDRVARMKEYEKLGFKAEQTHDDQSGTKTTEYILTNPSNYRTAIEREMLDSGKDKILIDRIGVKSIYYKNASSRMDFLYLADAICSYLSFNRSGNSQAEWIESFCDMADEINGKDRNLIWAYDDADTYFSRAWQSVEQGDYYKALSLSFDGMHGKSKMTHYYAEKWMPIIVKAIKDRTKASDFSTAVKKLKDSIFSNNVNQEKLAYIYEALESIGEKTVFANRKEESRLYDLYDAGVSAYTHIGDSKKAKLCFDKTKEYAEYVATETFLRTRNKMVVFLCDTLDFEAALTIADENVTYQELLSEMKKEIFGNRSHESLNYAISLSQRGQVYAFMEDDRAEKDFEDALKIMDEGTPDRLITQSYLLHHYISKGYQEKYELLAKDYFGGKESLSEQFNFLVREGAKVENPRFSMKFALYVFIKALYAFYLDDMPEKLFKKLKHIEKAIIELDRSGERQINGHPWEIIYKYLALIMIERGENEIANGYIEKIDSIIGSMDGIIKKIAEEGRRVCVIKKSGSSVLENKIFTYMYV